MTTVRVNRMHHPVSVLGHGVRLGIWVQGCSIGCSGCASHDTWDPTAVPERAIEQVIADASDLVVGDIDGVTVTGGEPFEQPNLADLLRALRTWLDGRTTNGDILVYSGMSLDRLQREFSDELSLIDAVVPEPYRAGAGPGGAWRGSSNQPVVPISDIGRVRYDGIDNRSPAAATVQIAVEGDRVWMIGVPRRGDLTRIERRLRAAGIELGEVSWRP